MTRTAPTSFLLAAVLAGCPSPADKDASTDDVDTDVDSDTDGDTDGDTDTDASPNTAPTVASVDLAPDPAWRADSLTCTAVGAADAEGDEVTLAWRWTRTAEGGDTDTLSETTATLDAASLLPGDAITCHATPSDGRLVGAEVSSSAVVIANHVPTVTGATLEPAAAGVEDTLTCAAVGFDDLDGDAPVLTWQWTVDGAVVPGMTDATLSGAFVRGDEVTCAVIPGDGFDEGLPVTSAALVIGNTPPALTVDLDTTTGGLCATWTCVAQVGDADVDDTPSVTFAWQVDGVDAGITEATWTPTTLSPGAVITCSATADDGLDTTSATSAGTTVVDAAPSLGWADLPLTAIQGDVLTCRTGDWFDDCVETPSWSTTWTVDGVDMAGGETFDTSGVPAGTEISCTATPTDGGQTGTPVVSPTAVVKPSGYRLSGDSNDDEAGYAVAVAGDLDGDGLPELVVGAPNASYVGRHAGRVYVVPGSEGYGDAELSAVATLGGWTWDGEEGGWDPDAEACFTSDTHCGEYDLPPTDPDSSYAHAYGPSGDGLGMALDAGVDVDGDGVGDIVIGAPFARGQDGKIWGGRAYVVSGASAGTTSLSSVHATVGGYVLQGDTGAQKNFMTQEANGDLAGYRVHLAHDHDGDGLDDVLLGVPNVGTIDAGMAYMVWGAQTHRSLVLGRDLSGGLLPELGYGMRGPTFEEVRFGMNLSSSPDVDGDGLGEALYSYGRIFGSSRTALLVGAPREGFVDVGLLPADQSRFVHTGLSSYSFFPEFLVYGGDAMLGLDVAGGGDVNGDGVPDVAAMSYGEGDGSPTLNVSFVHRDDTVLEFDRDADGAGRVIRVADVPMHTLRQTLKIVPDMNGDGLDEVAVGALGNGTTTMVVVFGRTDALDTTKDAIAGNASLGLVFTGPGLGTSLAAGDVNGDGLGDLVMGEPQATGRKGAVRVVFGRDHLGALTWRGGDGDDVWLGTPDDESVVGGLGDDVLDGAGGADVLYGGAGDDRLLVGDAGFRRVDGGQGFDTLVYPDPTLDLFELSGLLRSIEAIELSGSGQDVYLTPALVGALDREGHELWIRGDASATVHDEEGVWTSAGQVVSDGLTFDVFQRGVVELYVQEAVGTAFAPTWRDDVLGVPEDAVATDVVGPLPVEDADGALVDWTIVAGDPTGIFEVNASGELVVRRSDALDHEGPTPRFELIVQVEDDSGLRSMGTVTVDVLDANEPPTWINTAPVLFVEEGDVGGRTVGGVQAQDVDDGDLLTYSIAASTPLADAFTIDPVTGVIRVTSGLWLDHESHPTHTLTLVATDLGGLSTSLDATVDVGDETVLETSVSVVFSTENRSIWEDEAQYGFAVEEFPIGMTWSEDQGSGLGSFLGEFSFQGLTLPLPVDVQFDLTGSAELTTDFTFDGGWVDAHIPVDIDLSIPDELAAGSTVTLSSSWSMGSGASFGGEGPLWGADFDFSATDMGMRFATCIGGECVDHVDTSWSFPRIDLYEFDYPASTFSGVPTSLTGAPYELTASFTNQRLFDHTVPWDEYILQALQYASIPANVGSFTFEPSSAAAYGLSVDIEYVMWTFAYDGSVDLSQDLTMMVTGVQGEVTFEDGTVSPPFDVGGDVQLDVPATADANGDGQVELSIRYSLASTFGHETTFLADMSHTFDAGWMTARLRTPDDTSPWYEVGPVFQFERGVNIPVTASRTFDLGGFNQPTVVGALDLAP